MNNHDDSKQALRTVGIAAAFCALAAFGSQSAQAGATEVTLPTQLTNPVMTDPYPLGPIPTGIVPQSFTVAAGSDNLTFTATAGLPAQGFESFTQDGTIAPQFAIGTIVEDTTRTTPNNGANVPTGPLQIDFQTGVTGFGLYAQDYNFDTETFTLAVGLNGAAPTALTTFIFGPVDNTSLTGEAVFVGAQSNGGDLITSATLSSFSVGTPGGGLPNNGSNDFYFGPTSVQAVPEASTVISFGMGMLLFGGLAAGAQKRKQRSAKQAA